MKFPLRSTIQIGSYVAKQKRAGARFPLDFMIRYHLYRLHFPLMALGRLRERLAR